MIMANAYICENVNMVENEFSADSRDKDGRRVVVFDAKQALKIYLAKAHIIQIEEVVDRKDAVERSVISMSSGKRFVAARSAAVICNEISKST